MTSSGAQLELKTISAVSPSLAELLRLCPLRTGLSKADGIDPFVLGNPKAWLGIAYHEVLAGAEVVTPAGDSAVVGEEIWDRAIERMHERAQAHPLDRRFGIPERWLGYYLVRAIALMRSRQIASEVSGEARTTSGVGDGCRSDREKWLIGAKGRIVGRPDSLRDDAVVDYKTGSIYEYGTDNVIKASYVRQLQLYAFLVRDCTGCWPVRGVLLPMEGPSVEIKLVAADCERVAAETLELLDDYNDRLQSINVITELAKPCPKTCRWCPYQIVCPAFWESVCPSWKDDLGTATAGGAAVGPPRPIHDGAACCVSVNANQGTDSGSVIDLAPMRHEIHPAVQHIQEGTNIRAVGLARRADGTVIPTMRTILARAEDIPSIVANPAKTSRANEQAVP